MDEHADIDRQNSSASGDGRAHRERSSIAFPYQNLQDAIEIASAVYNNVGSGECSSDQLAAWVGQSSKSSGFRARISAAKLFGVLESGVLEDYRLSNLGRQIVDPNQERRAKVDAFLNVPLYQAVYEKHKGGTIPRASAMEQEIIQLGVAKKQAQRARAVLEKSAEVAGFSEHGRDRLVKPGVSDSATSVNSEFEHPSPSYDSVAGEDSQQRLHPFIQGLLKTLPEQSTAWSLRDRAKWLRLAANAFDLIYKSDDSDGEIQIRVVEEHGREQ